MAWLSYKTENGMMFLNLALAECVVVGDLFHEVTTASGQKYEIRKADQDDQDKWEDIGAALRDTKRGGGE